MTSFNLNSIASMNLPSSVPSNVSSSLPASVPSSAPINTTTVIPPVVSTSMPANVTAEATQGASIVMPSYESSNDDTEQLLKDIVNLQNIEKELFETLETNSNLTNEEYNKIVNKINSISEMRINIYNTLGGINNFYKNSIVDSQETLKQQMFAIKIVEEQLTLSRQKLAAIKLEKNNKVRLIEINEYYSGKYREHTILMKYVILMLLPIIILSYLFNKGFISNTIFYALLIFIAITGCIFIVHRLVSIMMRDNMNYQEYLWYFNIKNAPAPDGDGSNTNPWLSTNSLFGTCIGNSCCTDGMIYNTKLDKCVIDPNKKVCKESFVNNIFTQYCNPNKKPDVTLDNTIFPSNY
jgi:hypothetical protein